MRRVLKYDNIKSRFIINLFRRYQPQLNIEEQITLLDTWMESCVLSEEYEMAETLLKEKNYIEKNTKNIPQRKKGEIDFLKILDHNPLYPNRNKELVDTKEVNVPKNFWSRIFEWFKSLFRD